jgi:putative two-component system response regulator
MPLMTVESAKPTILIVEDEVGPRNALKVILRPFFNLYAVDTGEAAMRTLKERHVDLVTLDLKLPDRQGVNLLQEIKLERDEVEVIIITGYGSLKSAMDGIRYGAAAYLLKPFNVAELIALINQTLERKRRLDRFRGLLRTSGERWEAEQDVATVMWQLCKPEFLQPQAKQDPDPRYCEYSRHAGLLSELLEAKSRELFNHSSRTSFYTTLLAKQMQLAAGERKALAIGAFFHDLGKVVLEDRFLSHANAAPMEEADREIFRRHPDIGARMMLAFQVPAEVGQIISYHHEHFDGSGYPNGLQGEGIPLLARIVSIAQAFDHLVSGNMQTAIPVDAALERMRRMSGSLFDPKLVDCFLRSVTECKSSLPALAASSRSAALPDF